MSLRQQPVLIWGFFDAAKEYAHQHRLGPRDWRHVTEPHDLMGRNGGAFVVVHGSVEMEPDLVPEAKLRGMEVEFA